MKIAQILFVPSFLMLVIASCQTNQEKADQQSTDTTATNALSKKDTGFYATINEKIKQSPNNPDLYFERARFHLDKQDLKAAENDIERALRLDSMECDYLVLKADILFMTKKVQQANDVLKTCINHNDQHVGAHLKLAEIFFVLEEFPRSIENVNNALKIDVYNARAYFIKGMNYKYMGDTAKAVSSFQTAVEQDPDFYDSYIQLGLLYASVHNPLAVAYYDNALEVRPNSIEAHYNKAMFLQENGKPQEALKHYDQILEIEPKTPKAYYNKGYVYLVHLDSLEKAEKNFTNAINLHPRYVEAYYNLGFIYEQQGDLQKAESEYRTALQLKPDYTLAAKGISRIKGEE